MDDFDIYADLPSIHIEDENVSENKNILEEKSRNLEKEVNKLKTKIEQLESDHNKLKINFSSLIKTAKAEISRKDRTISELRSKLDNLTFRRNQRNQSNEQNVSQPSTTIIENVNTFEQYQLINNHQFNYPPPPHGKEFNYENQAHLQMNYFFNYPPPPLDLVFSTEKEQSQEINDNIPLENVDYTNQKYKKHEEKLNGSDDESNDGITKKSEYRNTVYGERLKKKLLKEKEDEKNKKDSLIISKEKEGIEKQKEKLTIFNEKEDKKQRKVKEKTAKEDESIKQEELKILKDKEDETRKKEEEESKILKEKENEKTKYEEELKEKTLLYHRANNKENVSLVNEAFQEDAAFNNDLNSVKTINALKNSSDIVESEILLSKKSESLQIKDHHKNINDDISIKYLNTNEPNIHTDNKNPYNCYNKNNQKTLSYKNYRSRDRSNKYDHNNLHHIESSNKYDRYNKLDKHYMDSSSHRHRSRHREKSNSSHRTKDDKVLKKHCETLEYKNEYTPKKIKNHGKEKTEKKKLEKSVRKKTHKDKIKTPKRKRSKSEEKTPHKHKRRKPNIDDISNDYKLKYESEIEKVKPQIIESKENIQEIKRKSRKDNEKLINLENTNNTEKTNILKFNEHEDDKKIRNNTRKENNNMGSFEERSKLYKNIEEKRKFCNSETKEIMQKRKNNDYYDSKINEISLSKDKEIIKITIDDVECSLEELEEGEIIDSPSLTLQDECLDYKKIENHLILTEIEIEKNIEKKSDNIQQDKNVKTAFSQKIEDTVSEIVNNDKEILETLKNLDNHDLLIEESNVQENDIVESKMIKNESPKNKIDEDKILCISLNQTNIKHDDLNMMHKKIDENIPEIPIINKKSLQTASINLNTERLSESIITDLEEKNCEAIKNNNINIPNFSIKNDTKIDQESGDKRKNINSASNKQTFKPLIDFEVSKNKETESDLNKKVKNILISKTTKNIIIVKRRRRPVQLSDSPPVIVITNANTKKTE